MSRYDGRENNQLRPIRITKNFTKYAEGSVLIEFGDTKVICNATVEENVPPFLRESGSGWVTAEYAMLPRATASRNKRDINKLKLNPRATEIQRLIGRALRAAWIWKRWAKEASLWTVMSFRQTAALVPLPSQAVSLPLLWRVRDWWKKAFWKNTSAPLYFRHQRRYCRRRTYAGFVLRGRLRSRSGYEYRCERRRRFCRIAGHRRAWHIF